LRCEVYAQNESLGTQAKGRDHECWHPPRVQIVPAPGRALKDEAADKPDSVEGDHPSATVVADGLVRPTRELGRAALGRSLSGLAPGGVYLATPVTWGAGGLLHHLFTLASDERRRRFVFCGTGPRVTPGGCCPPPCSVESGLSSTL